MEIVLNSQSDQFWDDFITQCVEPRDLLFGGGEQGFIFKPGRVSASEDDRQAVAAWLRARPEIETVQVGPLEDAWYAEGAGNTDKGRSRAR